MGEVASQVSLQDAQTELWNRLFSFINSMSLGCAVELGIADIIHSHGPTPATLLDLAASIPIPPNKTSHLRRLMRLLVHSGIFAVKKCDNGEEGFVLTPISSLIVQGRDKSNLSYFVSMMVDSSLVSPWHFLGEWLKGKDVTTAFRMYHGEEFWDKANQFPDFNRKFNTAMACDGQYVMNAVVGKCANAFEGLRSLVDVGGGTGGTARAIAEAFPNIMVSVLDLPHVVAGLPEDHSSVKFVGGDMFESIPPTDVVFLKWILHDWNDEDCVRILKKCKEAVQSREGGKVMILEMVVSSNQHGDYNQTIENQHFFDMMMMVLVEGKERTEEEWSRLLQDAGFASYKVTPVLGTRSIIEAYP